MEKGVRRGEGVTVGPFKKWIKKNREVFPIPKEDDFIQWMFRKQFEIEEPKNRAHLVRLMGEYGLPETHYLVLQAKTCFDRWQKTDPKAPIDGFSAKDKERIRKAARQVWSWSYPRRLCVDRATDKEGFVYCENPDCKSDGAPVPRIHVDHMNPVGVVDEGFLERLFCPSDQLQALCKKCHTPKTKQERLARLGRVHKDTRKKLSFCDEWDNS